MRRRPSARGRRDRLNRGWVASRGRNFVSRCVSHAQELKSPSRVVREGLARGRSGAGYLRSAPLSVAARFAPPRRLQPHGAEAPARPIITVVALIEGSVLRSIRNRRGRLHPVPWRVKMRDDIFCKRRAAAAPHACRSSASTSCFNPSMRPSTVSPLRRWRSAISRFKVRARLTFSISTSRTM